MMKDPDPERSRVAVAGLRNLVKNIDLNESLAHVRNIVDKKEDEMVNTMDAIAAVLRAKTKEECIYALHSTYTLLMFKIKGYDEEHFAQIFPQTSRLFTLRKLIDKTLITKFSPDSEEAQVLQFEEALEEQKR